MRVARLTADLTAVEDYPLTLADVQANNLLIAWPGKPTAATFEGTRYALVVDVDRPATAFGETAVEGMPELAAGAWRQVWTVQSITLEDAQDKLAQMVCDLYWDRMQAVPTPQALNAAGTFIGVIQARQTRYATPLATAKTNIQSASTIAQAYAIYQQLEDFT